MGELISDLIKILYKDRLPYEVSAPSTVITNLACNENHWVFHITNWTGDKFERSYVDDNYLAPVEDFHVSFQIPPGKNIKSVSCFVNMPFGKKINNGRLEIDIPRIEAYQAIDIEFE